MSKQLEKLAENYVDNGELKDANADASKHPYAYTQRAEQELRFPKDVAYDPRLIVAGITYGD